MSLTMMGVPANPRWLQRLAEEGKTEEIERIKLKGQRTKLQRLESRVEGQTPRRIAQPINLAPKGLVIMVNFSDLSWTKATHAEIDSMLNGQNYTRNYSYRYGYINYNVSSSGSARQYFYDSSFGQYNPHFTVVGPLTISQNYAYYGSNDRDGNDMYAEDMLVEACRLADEQGVDFTEYDNDGDGDIDFVYVLYAGYQESDGAGDNYIWPHSYSLDDYYYASSRSGGRAQSVVRLDGKRLNNYACSGEIQYYSNQHDGIGTFCHEFGHVLGLMDHYATDYSTHKAMGAWDIMDSGSYNNEGNTPPLYSAYEQFFMGWLTPTVISDTGVYTLSAMENTQAAYLICSGGQHNLIGNDPNPTTFYLLENRQKTGWDAHLPGHGLMITKIQYDYTKWAANTVNNTASAMGVDLIEADGSAPSYNESNPDNGWEGKATDLFPAGATSYTKINGYPIRDITEDAGVITFRIGNGSSAPSGSGGNCDNYSWTATQALSEGEVLLDDYTWTVTVPSGSFFSYESGQNNRGAQFGSRNTPIQSLSLSTSEVSNCLISSVKVNAAQGRDGDSKLSVYIDGTQIGTQQSLTSSTAQYTFTNSAQKVGVLDIRITNTAKAAYIKSINITQTTYTTDIPIETESKTNVRKVWRDGQLVIIKDGASFDVLGRRLE